MIAAAYQANGRQITLPKTGRKLLPCGTLVQEGNDFRELEADMLLIRGSEWDGMSQSTVRHETMEKR